MVMMVMPVIMSVIMVVIMTMMMVMSLPSNKTVQPILDHDRPDHNDEDARCHTEPGIELLRQNKLGGKEGDKAQGKDASRMSDRGSQP